MKFTLLMFGLVTRSCKIRNLFRNSFKISGLRSSTLLQLSNRNEQQSVVNVELERIIQQAVAWCGLNGLMYTDGKLSWTAAPISLVPNLYTASTFQFTQQIQPVLNELVDIISRDRQFLLNQLKFAAKSDDFIRRLIEIYSTVPEERLQNDIQMGVHRSDYMANKFGVCKQIEINTIASSFGCLSKKVNDFQAFFLNKYSQNKVLTDILNETWGFAAKDQSIATPLLTNPSIVQIAAVLAKGHELTSNKSSIILFVVQPGERNIADQRLLEQQLWSAHSIRVEFRTLKELSHSAVVDIAGDLFLTLDDSEGTLQRVSVVYFRAGYSPNDYPSEAEWDARALLERSHALKCPSVGYQLAGSKAIQAALTGPGVLEGFLSRCGNSVKDVETASQQVRMCFVSQFKLGGDDLQPVAAAAAVAEAEKDGSGWVLKPQREGGGNNLYGQQLSQFLKENKGNAVLGGYVLMERIFPEVKPTAFLRNGELKILPSISELGIYGTYLGDGRGAVFVNQYAGYLLRTKPDGVDEGGVASGYSVLNSIILSPSPV
mmetsp:Transcript_9818/g.14648  ORF Transcript_9818/g.14648 Transcript_9818/m.14648 type:complete len:545 (-) Transcript_9818:36-1670(-)